MRVLVLVSLALVAVVLAEDCPRVSVCATGTSPTKDSKGCPSCTTADGRTERCTPAQLAACLAGEPTRRVCATNEEPSRGTDCCMTCKVATCSSSALSTCETNYKSASFPVCATGVKPTWQRAPTCCFDCRPPAKDSDKPVGNKCTDAQRASCLNTVPTCTAGARPEFDPTSCCPSCIRPEALCTKTQVALCASTARACDTANGEKPVFVANECCPSCKPANPVCTPACAATENCVRTAKDSTTGACVPKGSLRSLRILLRAAATEAINFKSLTCADLPALLTEIVNRYCDQSVVADVCKTAGNVLAGMLVSKCTKDDSGDGSATIDIDLPPASSVSPTAYGITFFANDATTDAVTVVSAAMSDPSAANGFSITTSTSSASRSTISMLVMICVAMCALIATRLF